MWYVAHVGCTVFTQFWIKTMPSTRQFFNDVTAVAQWSCIGGQIRNVHLRFRRIGGRSLREYFYQTLEWVFLAPNVGNFWQASLGKGSPVCHLMSVVAPASTESDDVPRILTESMACLHSYLPYLHNGHVCCFVPCWTSQVSYCSALYPAEQD